MNDQNSRIELHTETKRYFTCPAGCDYKFFVEHLFHGPLVVKPGDAPRMAGPWFCHVCGLGWRLSWDADGVRDVQASSETSCEEWYLLELPPRTAPVLFKVRDRVVSSGGEWSDGTYYYDEHTCPINWLRKVEEVYADGREDPHGLWKLVGQFVTEAEADRAIGARIGRDEDP